MLKELKQRFDDGDEGVRRLRDQLLRQPVVAHDLTIADGFASKRDIVCFEAGDVLITQGDADTALYCILAGEVSIEVHGREVARRGAGEHVGEMSLIDPSERRSATVRATTATVAARISEEAFSELARVHPEMWRRLALELGNRLRQRAAHVRPRNERPEVFIGSCASAEGLGIAQALQAAHAFDPWLTRVWTDGTFGAGSTPIESLMAQLVSIDFALLVVTPDDIVDAGDGGRPGPRDNVVFELGLMIGALGRDRAYVVRTRGTDVDLKLPSDLAGVKALDIVPGPGVLAARVGPAATEFRSIAHRLGSR